MPQSLSRKTFVGALLGLILVLTAVTVRANHSWNGYHWARTSNPFTLKAGANVDSTWSPYLDDAVYDWSRSDVLDLSSVAGGTRPKPCKATAGRDEVCNASYGNNGWLGVAQIWISGLHITQGVVKLNDYYFNRPQYDTPSWRQMVVCQEVGHTLGLDHQDTNFNNTNLGTCMDYTSNPDGPPANTSPNKHDYDELDIIYQHLDTTTTVGQTITRQPPAMNEIDVDNPGNWGRLVASSNGARTQTFELDFGGGHKIVTFVIWADGPRGNVNH